MSDKKKVPSRILLAIGFLFLLITAAVVARPLFLAICVILVFVYLYINYAEEQKTGEEQRFLDSPALRDIRQSISECEAQLKKLEEEMIKINEEITDMHLHLEMADDLRPEALVEGRILIRRFEEQLALRKIKITFYHTCKQKLNSLQANHLLALTLEDKQKKLREYQENQYEELASMETLKTSLEREVMYLKTIDQLSSRMLNSQSVQEAEALRSELTSVTDELRRL